MQLPANNAALVGARKGVRPELTTFQLSRSEIQDAHLQEDIVVLAL